MERYVKSRESETVKVEISWCTRNIKICAVAGMAYRLAYMCPHLWLCTPPEEKAQPEAIANHEFIRLLGCQNDRGWVLWFLQGSEMCHGRCHLASLSSSVPSWLASMYTNSSWICGCRGYFGGDGVTDGHEERMSYDGLLLP